MHHTASAVKLLRYRVEIIYDPQDGDFYGDVWLRTETPGDGYYRQITPSADPNAIYEDLAEDVAGFLTTAIERMRSVLPLF